jgi:hypothetical protein
MVGRRMSSASFQRPKWLRVARLGPGGRRVPAERMAAAEPPGAAAKVARLGAGGDGYGRRRCRSWRSDRNGERLGLAERPGPVPAVHVAHSAFARNSTGDSPAAAVARPVPSSPHAGVAIARLRARRDGRGTNSFTLRQVVPSLIGTTSAREAALTAQTWIGSPQHGRRYRRWPTHRTASYVAVSGEPRATLPAWEQPQA